MFRHEFRRTPLSAAVPLEGSDTVVGLRELEQAQRREALQSLFGPPAGAHRCTSGFLRCSWLPCSSCLALPHCLMAVWRTNMLYGAWAVSSRRMLAYSFVPDAAAPHDQLDAHPTDVAACAARVSALHAGPWWATIGAGRRRRAWRPGAAH